MSQESLETLNNQTLIGYTDERGSAWHYRAELQGDESNHYPGAVPLDDIIRRLFNFTVEERPIFILTDQGYTELPDRKAMVTSDTEDALGIFKSGYSGHDYSEWLIDNVSTILDDSLNIGSAGLLRNRAQAWVSVEVPESITTPEGVEFRPHLLACTSYDGSLATTYKRAVQFVVCDNTLAAGLGEAGQTFKVRHSRHSGMRLGGAREALAVVHSMAEDFSAQIAHLTAWRVEDSQFGKVLDALVPVPDEKGRGQTLASKKRDELTTLYRTDIRAASWNGTALGVVQAFNTWNHHYATVRGGIARGQRNMENAIVGKYAAADAEVLRVLSDIAPRETSTDAMVAIG